MNFVFAAQLTNFSSAASIGRRSYMQNRNFQSTLFGNERNVDLAAALWLSVPVELLIINPIGS
jgi:hypothetical protein